MRTRTIDICFIIVILIHQCLSMSSGYLKLFGNKPISDYENEETEGI